MQPNGGMDGIRNCEFLGAGRVPKRSGPFAEYCHRAGKTGER